MKPIFEVCATTLEAVAAAKAAGANRVELCSALDADGVTPSAGLIQMAVKTGIPVHVLVRPREGDFCYTPEEQDAICADIDFCRQAGAAGVVLGALTPFGYIDWLVLEKFAARAQGLTLTFHRAFDLLANPFDVVARLRRLGFRRILTAGQAPTALQGIERLAELVKRFGTQVEIMPGGGITAENVGQILQRSGAKSVHFSAKIKSGVIIHHFVSGIEKQYWTTDEESIRAVIHAGKKAWEK